jgi:hypothetical protein
MIGPPGRVGQACGGLGVAFVFLADGGLAPATDLVAAVVLGLAGDLLVAGGLAAAAAGFGLAVGLLVAGGLAAAFGFGVAVAFGFGVVAAFVFGVAVFDLAAAFGTLAAFGFVAATFCVAAAFGVAAAAFGAILDRGVAVAVADAFALLLVAGFRTTFPAVARAPSLGRSSSSPVGGGTGSAASAAPAPPRFVSRRARFDGAADG